ncbi:MAG: hypothetical protein ACQETD_07590 [Pseudomonadota bacterium]
MKKFTLIPVGDCFEYQGKHYSKTGPLTAVSLEGNRQRMIPRSALVAPLGDETPSAPATLARNVRLDAETVMAAFEQYHNGCLEWLRLAEQELTPATATQIRTALDQARARFSRQLDLEP